MFSCPATQVPTDLSRQSRWFEISCWSFELQLLMASSHVALDMSVKVTLLHAFALSKRLRLTKVKRSHRLAPTPHPAQRNASAVHRERDLRLGIVELARVPARL